MGGIFKKLSLIGTFIAMAAAGFAQKVNFEVHAPAIVAAGEMFNIEFAVNAKPDEGGFKAPAFTGFNVVAGPTVSSGMSTTIVNGEVSRTESYAYTYVLIAPDEGKFTVPPAEIRVGGKSYQTRPLTIEVVADASRDARGSRQAAAQGGQARQAAGLAPDDILIVASANRTEVYKGQPLRVTLKLYQRVPLSDVQGTKLPAFNGFWRQDLPPDNNRTWKRETYNSKVYDAIVLGEYLLYPQQSGNLQIEPFEITVVAQIITQTRRQSMLDDFFGGNQTVQQVPKELRSRPITIRVKDFPQGAPAGFNGAVGNFTFDAQLSSPSVAANSAATYTIKISGSGNLPLIQSPKLELPGSFEQYNIKTTESLSTSVSGISGYRQFDYPFIARAEGTFPINPVDFTYFNPETGRYVTLSTPAQELTITPDAGGGARNTGGGMVTNLTKEEVKIIGQDIRFIKIGAPNFSAGSFMLIGSAAYFAALALIVLLAVAAYVYTKRRIRHLGNIAAVKGKRANKVALQRFNAADGYKNQGDRRRFLEEMLRALWGYMGDRLNIPVAHLTKDSIREELTKRNVPAQQVERYVSVISDCELAQYSPETTGQADELYRAGVEAISNMESILK